MTESSRAAFTSIAPGRLCLFGEHQDYLHLPVIALALPLTCRIHVVPNKSDIFCLHVPQLNKTVEYNLNEVKDQQQYGDIPDFALSALQEAIHDGWPLTGAECTSTTDIVMKAGCSSSTAFCVALVQALAKLSGMELSPLQLGQKAHKVEVTHFGAPGGTMDHLTSALAGHHIWRIGPDMWQYEAFQERSATELGMWVLAYSGEPKDTMKHLWRCKTARVALLQDKLEGDWDHEPCNLTEEEGILLETTRINRDTEARATALWNQVISPQDTVLGERLGKLMLSHHYALRDGLRLSTPRLEAIREAALEAGAWGYKVVGSGGGGCAVAWVPVDKADVVAIAMAQAGSTNTWMVSGPQAGAHIAEDK